MNVHEKFGDLGIIESKKESQRPVESWEDLVHHGEIVIERVHAWNTKLQQDTLAEFNQVVASSKLSQERILHIRQESGVDNKLSEHSQQMDTLAETAAQEITAATTAH